MGKNGYVGNGIYSRERTHPLAMLGAAYGVTVTFSLSGATVEQWFIHLFSVKNKNAPTFGTFSFLVAGMGFEPHDLQVMSLASYRTALPRDKVSLS